MDRDPRYDLIREKIAEGNIRSFNDIFFFVPKTVIANDLGKKVERFNEVLEHHIERLTLEDIYDIAERSKVSKLQIYQLVEIEYDKQNKKKRKKADQS